MKKIFLFLVIGVGSVFFVSCAEKKQSDDIVTRKPEKQVRKSTQRIGDYSQSRTFDRRGKSYTVTVERKADTSLPVVDDGVGNKYYDNIVHVRITAQDGKDFFDRIFTKNDFASFISDEYSRNNALLGVVFDHAGDDAIYFAASVGSPDKMSDEYVPLVVRVSYTGALLGINEDTMLDTGNDPQEEHDGNVDEEHGV